MHQPPDLQSTEPLTWSPGTGVEVWALFCAIIDGDLESVTRLLDTNPALVRCHYEYRTPICFAVRENRLAIAALLLDRGADPLGLAVNDSLLQVARDRGYTEMENLLEDRYISLHGASTVGEQVAAAIREQDFSKAKALLDASPELLHAGDNRSNQPIHWATMTRQLGLIDELLARGADINARRQDGARPIHLTNGDYHYRGWRDVPKEVETTPAEVLAHLRIRGACIDLNTAAHIGDIDRVRELLAEDLSLANRLGEHEGYYLGAGAPLKNAAAGGHIEIVRLLLDHGADPNLREEGIAPNGHALYVAVFNRHHDIARLLLDHGAFPNPEVESSADALWIAIRNGDKQMIELISSFGVTMRIPPPMAGDITWDYLASVPGLVFSVPILAACNDLTRAGALFQSDPTLANDPEALAIAAGKGHENFVRLLIHYQPELPQRTVLVARTSDLTRRLFINGMNPGRPDWLGITLLHECARKSEPEKAVLFLDHGADLNARDEDLCSTPLAWAAKFGKAFMVKLFLWRGAQPRLPDDPLWATPLAWATRRGHTHIADMLIQAENGILPRRPAQGQCTALTTDLVSAYDTGDADALQRLADYYQFDRIPNPEQLRERVWQFLDRSPGTTTDRLSLTSARRYIALTHGLKKWSKLTEPQGIGAVR